MRNTKSFPTADVMSVVTGVLVSPNGIGGVYEILNWMTGESVFTHQLPRIGKEAVPVIIGLHPAMTVALDEAKDINSQNWREYLAIWEARYGQFIDVPNFCGAQHQSINPLSELIQIVGSDRVVVVNSEAKA